MKNTINVLSVRVLGIIAIVAVIGLTMIACNKSGGSSGNSSKSSGGGGKSLNSAEELKKYLDSQPVNGPDKPIKVSMTINDPMLWDVGEAIDNSSKYVSLNITGNVLTTIPGGRVPWAYIPLGIKTLVGITIPSSVTSIGDYAFYSCTSLTSVTFATGSNISDDNFGDDAFPEEDGGGDTLKTAYSTGKAGTYTRETNGSTWTKK